MSYKVDADKLILTNGLFVRSIQLPNKGGQYLLKEYHSVGEKNLFFNDTSEEFSFTLNETLTPDRPAGIWFPSATLKFAAKEKAWSFRLLQKPAGSMWK